MEDYRQSLRKELKQRKFAHKHYSPEQIAKAQKLRRQQLESDIQLHRDELDQSKPPSLASRIFNSVIRRKSGTK
jgi:hypothetical protein